MLGFLKKYKLITFMSLVLMTVLSAVVLSTVAWFTYQNAQFTINNLTVNSKILESYFGGGDGLSAQTALVISRPVHLYNLSYLHESNTMQLSGWSHPFADQGLYFQFGEKVSDKYYFYTYDGDGKTSEATPTSKTLNMNYYDGAAGRGTTLLPIGTTAHPFIGHIIGNDLTVENLHIDGSGQADIGIFGYVGSGGTVSNCFFEKPVIDATGADARATSVETSPHTSYTNIGYLAGHITNANQFTNVYANRAQLKNSSGSSYQMINATGFFGKVDDPSVTPATSSTYAFGLNAKNAYDALDYANTEGSGKALVVRNADYDGSGPYTNAVVSSSSTYTFNEQTTNDPYSLSTIGFNQGNEASMYLRYFANDGHTIVRNPDISTVVHTANNYAKPSSWDVNDDGYHIYYENGQWKYTYVTPVPSDTEVPINFNCFTISFIHDLTSGTDVQYYLKANPNTNKLNRTTTSKESASDSDKTYYNFVFREVINGTCGGRGISEFSSADEDRQVYIYSPELKKYLYTEAEKDNSTYHEPSFVSDYDDATVFVVNGPETKIRFKDPTNGFGALCCSTSDEDKWGGHRNTGNDVGTFFTLGSPESTTINGKIYQRITSLSDLTDNCRVIFAAKHSNTWYAMHTPAMYNLLADPVTVDETKNPYEIIDASKSFKMRVTVNANSTYSFRDLFDNSYLSNSYYKPTGTNTYRRLELVDNPQTPCEWTLTPSSGEFTMVGSVNVSADTLVLNGGSKLFACYDSVGSYDKVNIFKRAETDSPISGLKSEPSEVKSYYAKGSTDKNEQEYSLCITSTTTVDRDDASAFTLFTEAPSGSTTFSIGSPESTVRTLAATTNYWRRITSESQMTSGDKFLIVNESDGVAMSTIQDTNYRESASVTVTSGYINDNTLSGNVQRFTGVKANGKWSFATNGGYLAAGSSSTDSLITSENNDDNSKFTISFTISGNATITFQGSYTHNILGYDSTNDIFSSYSTSTGTIQIYRYIQSSSSNATFVGDIVGGLYEPDRIDVVGSASFVEDGTDHYFRLNEACSVVGASSPTPDGTKDFYATTEVIQGGIVIIIDKTGSNDLGSLVVTYENTGEECPYLVNKSGSSISFSTMARDKDSNGSDHIHEDVINFSSASTNIGARAYCGLTSAGKIVTYDDNSVSKYVIIIGAANTIKIRDIQFSFTNIPGNIGKFSSVDFRTAAYSSGSLSGSYPSQNGIAIYYDVNDPTLTLDIRVKYSGSTYYIYVNTNKAFSINVFLYDESATVNVNGTAYYATSNQCAITAGYTIPAGWDS